MCFILKYTNYIIIQFEVLGALLHQDHQRFRSSLDLEPEHFIFSIIILYFKALFICNPQIFVL